MAKQTNQLSKEIKQLDTNVIDPSLLYVRKLGGRSVNWESSMPPINQLSPRPNPVCRVINNNSTPTVNSLQPPICQSTPEASSSVSVQSSPELDTDQGKMLDKTIKHVTHKLNQRILTSDIGTTNPERTASAGTSKPIKMPIVTDIWTPTITDNPGQDSTAAFQLPRNTSLHATNIDPR